MACRREQARKDIDTIAQEVLANPVIEESHLDFNSSISVPISTPALGGSSTAPHIINSCAESSVILGPRRRFLSFWKG